MFFKSLSVGGPERIDVSKIGIQVLAVTGTRRSPNWDPKDFSDLDM
jgi:hypothetical protein